MSQPSYHHGDLRRAVLDAAIEVIGESGPAAVSLRGLARRTGVTHAAPRYHFRSKEGVFTALAAEGFSLFADALDSAGESPAIADLGVVYVRFARDHRAHFEVMFRPDLVDSDDPALASARDRAWATLSRAVLHTETHQPAAPRVAQLGAWALVHGFAQLFAADALTLDPAEDVDDVVRAAAALMFPAESNL
ncbi:MAG: TetR/AcrR family transcriptional regulator [Nocardioides sp.]|uniref:TetR/AcrR family transcriptional regulator n=1 Tax=Nocardioides sp. TaxID=35761 RepID=UPI003D6A7BB7